MGLEAIFVIVLVLGLALFLGALLWQDSEKAAKLWAPFQPAPQSGKAVRDPRTDLVWIQHAHLAEAVGYPVNKNYNNGVNWYQAQEIVSALNAGEYERYGYGGGHSDWRLPTPEELIEFFSGVKLQHDNEVFWHLRVEGQLRDYYRRYWTGRDAGRSDYAYSYVEKGVNGLLRNSRPEGQPKQDAYFAVWPVRQGPSSRAATKEEQHDLRGEAERQFPPVPRLGEPKKAVFSPVTFFSMVTAALVSVVPAQLVSLACIWLFRQPGAITLSSWKYLISGTSVHSKGEAGWMLVGLIFIDLPVNIVIWLVELTVKLVPSGLAYGSVVLALAILGVAPAFLIAETHRRCRYHSPKLAIALALLLSLFNAWGLTQIISSGLIPGLSENALLFFEPAGFFKTASLLVGSILIPVSAYLMARHIVETSAFCPKCERWLPYQGRFPYLSWDNFRTVYKALLQGNLEAVRSSFKLQPVPYHHGTVKIWHCPKCKQYLVDMELSQYLDSTSGRLISSRWPIVSKQFPEASFRSTDEAARKAVSWLQ